MTGHPSSVLYTRDEELAALLIRISASITSLIPIAEKENLERQLSQFGDTVLLADVRAPDCLDVLSYITRNRPGMVVIVFGAERSDPMLAVEALEPFAMVSLEPERRAYQAVLKQAIESLGLRKKNSLLEHELTTLNARLSEPEKPGHPSLSASLKDFTRAQRNFDNIAQLFESVVDGLVASARVSRAGIFIKPDGKNHYLYQAGTRCLASTERLAVESGDPFIHWLEMHTHLISRSTLSNIQDPSERDMLKGMLDAHGAEIITPIYASGHIKGWIFIGQRSIGIPFDIRDLEELTSLADHISTTLEKALQFEATTLQKTLAETVLHSISFGIIACDEQAIIRWFNSAAHEILQPIEDQIIGQRIEVLGSRVADLFHRSLANETMRPRTEWTENRTRLTISAQMRRLVDDVTCVGSVMMLRDVTGAKLLQEKEDQLERAAFWNELASSMSHEIRNPLVAIKTFAQLLPDRYEDPDFRAEFSEQVTTEVDQLNHIVDKINEFANPPKPIFEPIDIRKPIERAVTRLQSELDADNLKIHLSADDSHLQINGDHRSLEECVYHLLKNSAENLANKQGSRIHVAVKGRAPQDGAGNIYITISDNGSGIDESVRDKVYSPFSTIKARGLGLGLPIAKRAVIDHNGEINIETSSGGTTITIILPSLSEGEV